MERRRFLRVVTLGCGAALVGCGDEIEDPAVNYPPAAEWLDPGGLRTAYTRVDGLRMHALVSTGPAPAQAPAMVLVHGSGLSGRYMIPTARELARDFRVYLPDIPGYGDSDDPGRVLNVPQMADWLAAWLSAVGLTRASFLGNSFGCQVIADLAARYPQYVEAAILQGPTTPPNERSAFWQFVRWRQNQAHNPEFIAAATDEEYRKAGIWRLIRSFIFQITDRIEDKAPLIRAPTLVIRGALDPIATQEYCEMLVRLLPRGQLHIIPEVAHTLVFTAPTPLATASRDFVNRYVSAGTGGGATDSAVPTGPAPRARIG
jgi:2-hydroxy-6-oxonona-2,4-dienedioate hydrolase